MVDCKRRDLAELVAAENLKGDEAAKFFEGALRDGVLKTTGTDIDQIHSVSNRSVSGGCHLRQNEITVRNKYYDLK